MKALVSEHKMRTHEIKHLLDIAWGELSNHIKSLEEKGFVEIVDEFDEAGQVVQTIYILEAGRKEFEQLYKVLKQFTADDTPLGDIVYGKDSEYDDHLYPK